MIQYYLSMITYPLGGGYVFYYLCVRLSFCPPMNMSVLTPWSFSYIGRPKQFGRPFLTDDDKLRMREFDADVETQRWVKCGNKLLFRDDPSRCLQVKSGGLMSKAKVEVGEYSGDPAQRWTFEYI